MPHRHSGAVPNHNNGRRATGWLAPLLIRGASSNSNQGAAVCPSSETASRTSAASRRPSFFHPKSHPVAQIEALRGSFSEFGICDVFVAFEPEPGKLQLIDGHGRTGIAGNQQVPCVVLDVTPEEARTLLAVSGQTALVADWDPQKIADIVASYQASDADLAHFLSGFGDVDAPFERGGLPGPDNGPDEMDLRPHEHYDFVVVLARTTQEWGQLCDLLSLTPVGVGRGSQRNIGLGRAVQASKLISLLEQHGNSTDSNPES